MGFWRYIRRVGRLIVRRLCKVYKIERGSRIEQEADENRDDCSVWEWGFGRFGAQGALKWLVGEGNPALVDIGFDQLTASS